MKVKRRFWDLVVFLTPFVLITGLFLFNGIAFVHIHEVIHVTIYESYDIDSEIEWDLWNGRAYTTPNQTQYRRKCNERCRFSQDLAEIIGYNVGALMLTAWVVVLSIVVFFMHFELIKRRFLEDERYTRRRV